MNVPEGLSTFNLKPYVSPATHRYPDLVPGMTWPPVGVATRGEGGMAKLSSGGNSKGGMFSFLNR